MQEPRRESREDIWEFIDRLGSIERRFGRLDKGLEDLTEMAIRRHESHDNEIANLRSQVADLQARTPARLQDRLPLSVREIIGWAILGVMSLAGAVNGDVLGEKLADTLIGRVFH